MVLVLFVEHAVAPLGVWLQGKLHELPRSKNMCASKWQNFIIRAMCKWHFDSGLQSYSTHSQTLLACSLQYYTSPVYPAQTHSILVTCHHGPSRVVSPNGWLLPAGREPGHARLQNYQIINKSHELIKKPNYQQNINKLTKLLTIHMSSGTGLQDVR